jgi:hypothetical protein
MAASPNLSSLLSSIRVDMRDLGDCKSYSQEELNRQAINVWNADSVFCSLQKLAYSLSVDRIVLAEMTNRREPEPIGPSSQGLTSKDIQGIYAWQVSTETVDEEMNNWHLSSRQKSDVRKIVSNGGAVIIVSAFADDACEILSHELGHHISEFHAGFNRRAELFTAPTNLGREDSRLDPYCRQNKAEFFAESFRFYLTGEPMRKIDLRGILKRVRKNDSRAFNLLRNYRKRAVRAAHISARSLNLNRDTSLAA